MTDLSDRKPATVLAALRYYPGTKVGQAFQPDDAAKSGWKA
ncbi:MAG TPA: hypothetical protein VFW33_15770 [Gemmataceae bacterium]|nr:hypothetical protein [Gemmataceae bacterium]